MKYRVYDSTTNETIRTVDICKDGDVRQIDILRSVQAVQVDFWEVEIDGKTYNFSDVAAERLPDDE